MHRSWRLLVVAVLAFVLTPRSGLAATNYFNVVDVFDPAANSWSLAAPMPVGGRPTAAVAAPDGNIYVFGIEGSTTTYAFTPATNRWSARAPLPTRRAYFAAALGGDGRIYTIGGQTGTYAYTNVVEAYDPRTDRWSEAAPISAPRAQMAAVTAVDGRIYLFGGYSDTGKFLGSQAYATAEVYSPAANAWSTVASMPAAAIAPAAASGPDGRLYVIGLKGQANVAGYDPVSNTWSVAANPLVRRGGAAAATGRDGRIYLFGGSFTTETLGGEHGDIETFRTTYLDDAEAFAPSSGRWTSLAPLPTARTGLVAATDADGQIYTFGGWSVTDEPATSTASSPAPASRGWIAGHVTLAGTATPVPGVSVQLVATPLSTRTAADGSYEFPGVSVTDGVNGGPVYTVAVTPPAGYAIIGPASRQVTVQAGQGVEADFIVQPPPCRFVLGFAALNAALPTIVGDCLDDERHNPANGDALQHTTHGLLVWRKADNFTAFTDGYRTWVAGPYGVQERLNSQRFPWEGNPDGLPVVR